MFSTLRLWSLAASLASAAALGGCAPDATPVLEPGEKPPLPPSSGTPVGYLLDSASSLELTPEQIAELEQIDTSLSARNESIATQLREIERPEQQGPVDPKAPPPPPPNMAPGAQPIRTTPDAQKLHAARDANTKAALEKAFTLLQPTQQEAARKLLSERGITAPPAPAPAPAPPTTPTPEATSAAPAGPPAP